MGWWGYNIMEGDTPLDCEGDIISFLADPVLVQQYDDGEDLYDTIQEAGYNAIKMEANVLSVHNAIQNEHLCSYEPNIAMQVLGEMVMCVGGVFPQVVRDACKLAAKVELNEGDGGWKEEGARAKCLRAYILRVNDYVDGTPYEPTSQGLFAKIAEGLS